MTDEPKYTLVPHTFRAGETVNAVFKNYNNLRMTPRELELVTAYFIMENEVRVLRPGHEVQIPILKKYYKETTENEH